MRDYKKGKFLLESKPGQLLPASLATASGSQSQSSSSAVSESQKRIFDKVWAAVEKVMSEMRETLLGQLKEPSRSVEEQEKTIEYATAMAKHPPKPNADLCSSVESCSNSTLQRNLFGRS